MVDIDNTTRQLTLPVIPVPRTSNEASLEELSTSTVQLPQILFTTLESRWLR